MSRWAVAPDGCKSGGAPRGAEREWSNKPTARTRWAVSLWAVALVRCKTSVKELALKAIGETRCKPSRSQGWLRSNMASSNEADFNLRGIAPLSRNILHTLGVASKEYTGQRVNRPKGYRDWLRPGTSPKDETEYLVYPVSTRDTVKNGIGCFDNRCLSYFVESLSVNVGGSCWNAKASSLPMSGMSVGGVIVV
jgi:hypothetical protein